MSCTEEAIQTESVPNCPGCGTQALSLYAGIRDHTFGTPGKWALSRCPSCGLIWLDPRPTIRDIGKVYATYYTHEVNVQGSTFRKHVNASSASRRLVQSVTGVLRRAQDAVLSTRFGYSELSRGRWDALLAYTLGALPGMARGASLQVLGLKASERGRVLDVGCGNGTFLARMKSLGWQCVGHETDAVAARFARESFGLEIREGTLADAGFADASFDVVTLSHVIEHVHAPVDLVSECKRLLKPNGKLIVLTPNTRGLGHRIFRESWRGLEPPRHIHCFQPSTLRNCVERAGMQSIQLTTESRMMRAIWYTSRLIQRAEREEGKANNAFDYLAAYAMQMVESAACRLIPDAGEEIMLAATKPDARQR